MNSDIKILQGSISELSKRYNLPQDKEELEYLSLSNWNILINEFPDFKPIVNKLNFHLHSLNINTPRGIYLWGWLFFVTQFTSLDSQDNKKQILIDNKSFKASYYSSFLKLLGIVFDVIVDDLGDQYNNENSPKILDYLKNYIKHKDSIQGIERLKLNQNEINTTRFAVQIFDKLLKSLNHFEDKYLYNLIIKHYIRLIDAGIVKYKFNNGNYSDQLKLNQYINRSKILNATMHITLNNLIDLMIYSYLNKDKSLLIRKDLKKYIKLSKYLETLGRIGDDISTWEREVINSEFTSMIARYLIFQRKINCKNIQLSNFSLENKELATRNVLSKYMKVYNTLNHYLDTNNLDAFDLSDILNRYLAGYSLQLNSIGNK